MSPDSNEPKLATYQNEPAPQFKDALGEIRKWSLSFLLGANFYRGTSINHSNKHELALPLISLIIGGGNSGEGALKNAGNLAISDKQFQEFLERYKDIPCLVLESDQLVS